MARIRTIKPEFPQSETTGKMSREARLLFIQLWTVADDEGRSRAASRMLASLLYPYDDDARDLMDGWLDELERHECIRRYEVDGSSYLEITNWLKHQKIDHPSKSRLPEFREGSREARESSRTLAPDLGPRTKDQDAASNDAHSDEADLFRRGKEVCGPTSGGLIAKLLKFKKGSVPLARAAIEQAATKSDPREYLGRVLAGPPPSDFKLMSGIEGVL